MEILERKGFDFIIPVGSVQVLYLPKREEFIKLVAILAHKGDCSAIPDSMGAVSFLGIKNWNRINKVKAEVLGSDNCADFFCELSEIGDEENLCKDVLIIVTRGYYSNLDFHETPYSEEEWLQKSLELRIYHEITHVICRKKFPDMIEPIWDEIVADFMGMIWSLGSYNRQIAEKCLGIYGGKYVEGGRLQNYVEDEEELEKIFVSVKNMIFRLAEYSEVLSEEDRWGMLYRIQQEHREALVKTGVV